MENHPIGILANDCQVPTNSTLLSTTDKNPSVTTATTTVVVPETRMEVVGPLDPAQIRALSRQLEHYFSSTNLAKDTYLQTLRELNDGCVPVKILAGFAKIKAILGGGDSDAEEDWRARAIVQVIQQLHAPRLLELQMIDKQTGKQVSTTTMIDDQRTMPIIETVSTLMAVGVVTTCSTHPPSDAVAVPRSTTTTPSTTTTMSGNTIILRDVPMCVTQEEVRGLLDEIDECPPIVSIMPEVANCWLVAHADGNYCVFFHFLLYPFFTHFYFLPGLYT
jgi:hypothetical protein